MSESKFYDAYYYQHGCGRPYERNDEWLRFFGVIAQKIAQAIAPRTVLDAGCAMGFLVEGLRKQGIQAFGIDVSEYALERVRKDLKPFCTRASIADPLSERYDLIVTIEVLEHLPAVDGERAIANLCEHADDILFSSTPFDFKEATHLNVQPPDYWAELFARHGFYRDVEFDGSFITPWTIRFRRLQEPLPRIVRAYERRYWSLWKENSDLRDWARELRDKMARDEETARSLDVTVRNQAHEIQTLRDQVNGFLNSTSWRIMKPFQRIRAWLFPVRQ